MIQHIHPNLYIGNLRGYQDCQFDLQYLSLTHRAVPRGDFKHIDMVDADDPYYFHLAQFKDAIEFLSKGTSLVFCDQGGSRAPSIGLLYLSLIDHIDPTTYFSACRDFKSFYPWYKPNTGIRTFMAQNWSAIQETVAPYKDALTTSVRDH